MVEHVALIKLVIYVVVQQDSLEQIVNHKRVCYLFLICRILFLFLAGGNCPVGFCLSGGVCTMIGNMPICQCPLTHTGTRCETEIGTQITTTATLTTVTATTGSTIKPSKINQSLYIYVGNLFSKRSG